MTENNFYLGLAYECSRCMSVVIVIYPGKKNNGKHDLRCCNKFMKKIDGLKHDYFKLPENK